MVPRLNENTNQFDYLYDSYAPALYGAALKLAKSVDVASIILEKCFLRIWTERIWYNVPENKLLVLMLRIMLEEYKTYLRHSADPSLRIIDKSTHLTLLREKQGLNLKETTAP